MRFFVIFFFVAKSVLAQDTASITQAELLHRTQTMYDAVATGVKAPSGYVQTCLPVRASSPYVRRFRVEK